MSRRITIAIVGVVLGTMLLAGIGTIVATRVGNKAREIQVLEDRANGIADLVPNLVPNVGADRAGRPALADAQQKLLEVLGLSGVSQLRITARGQLVGDPPNWIPSDEFDIAALASGGTISGSRGNRIWAAAARTNPNGSATVAVVTDTRDPILGPAIRWLGVSAAVAMLLGISVSILLGRRLARPIRDAVDVTERIAAGDLSVRLPHHGPPSDELSVLGHSINSMAGELERSRALEHQFLMSVSHDLRTPLTSIRGYAEAIADGMVDDPALAADVIVTESQRLERLVSDLLDLAKLDARKFGFRLEQSPIGPVLEAAVARLTPEAAAAGIHVHVAADARASTPLVLVDPDRLAQAIGNLTSNSLKFARTAVWVRARPQASPDQRPGIAIDVADDGDGIDDADLPHVFERLYQATSRVRPQESGSGLGLAIVKELVEGMGGTVAVASVAGSGATFTIWLPTVA